MYHSKPLQAQSPAPWEPGIVLSEHRVYVAVGTSVGVSVRVGVEFVCVTALMERDVVFRFGASSGVEIIM